MVALAARGTLAAITIAASACTGPLPKPGAKILVTPGAYKLVQKNHQASAVFADDAAREPQAELICERVTVGRQLRTLCYARTEEAARVRNHRDKWLELTTLPGAGG